MKNSFINFLAVGTGGFIGAILRYIVGGCYQNFLNKPIIPFGTLTVNVAGCFVIGFLGGLSESKNLFNTPTRLFIFVGILGGFTTFSTFGYETISMLREHQPVAAFFNVTLNVFVSLAAVWIGYSLSN